jgi:hypothetical protein
MIGSAGQDIGLHALLASHLGDLIRKLPHDVRVDAETAADAIDLIRQTIDDAVTQDSQGRLLACRIELTGRTADIRRHVRLHLRFRRQWPLSELRPLDIEAARYRRWVTDYESFRYFALPKTLAMKCNITILQPESFRPSR